MTKIAGTGGVLATGIILGIAIGVGLGSDRQGAQAADADLSIRALEAKVTANSREIAALKRLVAAHDGRIKTVDRRSRANRDATKAMATRSGVRVNLSDD